MAPKGCQERLRPHAPPAGMLYSSSRRSMALSHDSISEA